MEYTIDIALTLINTVVFRNPRVDSRIKTIAYGGIFQSAETHKGFVPVGRVDRVRQLITSSGKKNEQARKVW